MDRASVARAISMPPPEAIRAMDNRACDAIIEGRPRVVGQSAGMLTVEIDLLLTEVQDTANDAPWGSLCAPGVEVELEEIPPQDFDIDVTGQCQRCGDTAFGC